jgi:hypothetical protein
MISLLSAKSRNTEVDGTVTHALNGYNLTSLNTNPDMELIMNSIKNKSVLMGAAIGRLKEKSDQKTNDEVRDTDVDGLYYFLLGASHSPKTKVKEAATYLLELFEQYGQKMKDESYTRESSMINSLLNDYKSERALAAIADVPQCADYIAALQTSQSIFEGSRLDFETARGQEGTLENASAIKGQLIELVNKQLVPYVNVMVQLHSATYESFARTLAEIISANNEVVKKRRNKNDKPEEGED